MRNDRERESETGEIMRNDQRWREMTRDGQRAGEWASERAMIDEQGTETGRDGESEREGESGVKLAGETKSSRQRVGAGERLVLASDASAPASK